MQFGVDEAGKGPVLGPMVAACVVGPADALPEGVDDAAITDHLLSEHGIEVAGGLGDLAGDVLRIGCMGRSARPANVLAVVAALGDALAAQGSEIDVDAGLAATQSKL